MGEQRLYWIAIRSIDGAVTVAGPFLFQEAVEQRDALQQAGGHIGAVFASSSRASAELNARFYLPEPAG